MVAVADGKDLYRYPMIGGCSFFAVVYGSKSKPLATPTFVHFSSFRTVVLWVLFFWPMATQDRSWFFKSCSHPLGRHQGHYILHRKRFADRHQRFRTGNIPKSSSLLWISVRNIPSLVCLPLEPYQSRTLLVSSRNNCRSSVGRWVAVAIATIHAESQPHIIWFRAVSCEVLTRSIGRPPRDWDFLQEVVRRAIWVRKVFSCNDDSWWPLSRYSMWVRAGCLICFDPRLWDTCRKFTTFEAFQCVSSSLCWCGVAQEWYHLLLLKISNMLLNYSEIQNPHRGFTWSGSVSREFFMHWNNTDHAEPSNNNKRRAGLRWLTSRSLPHLSFRVLWRISW